MKHVITFRVLVDTKGERDEQMLEKASSFILEQAEKQFKSFHYDVQGSEVSNSGKPTKEEAMRLVPRRKHFGEDGHALCTASRMFPKDATTPVWAKVDCKQCLKKRPETQQKELFT